ncbi:FAD-dependent oxidoreductase [Streptomyces sedi]|uniref:FAD-dependent oxidoreductase n=1 Tax=Streptomyces sedi TaxID=555059 RepID=A0A5C4V6F9_9ACTN|nr:FAD-dependent oxidoreductase [Streptomyces sedi]TNM31205.1 FAD-dependent oxidoreductase [Streptomyces sedi]
MSDRRSDVGVDVDVDVVVVGAGGGGLTAAIAAAEAGASVALLEKLERWGGNTFVSTGSIPAAGTRYQKAAGIEDDPERMTADLLRQSGGHDAEHLVRFLAEESASLVEWLVEQHAVDLRIITDYKHVGHSVQRLHAPPDRRGESLVKDLTAAAKRLDVDVVTGNPVRELLVEDGRVVGVRVAGDRAGSYELRAHSVVLAANGFGNNKEMIARWIPESLRAQYFGAEGSTGEAIAWADQLGARLLNMGAFQGYAAVAYPHGSIVSWTSVEKGGFLLSPDGLRMGDESVGYSGFAPVVAGVAEESWVVFDTRIRDFIAGNEPEFAELVDAGGVKEAATPEAAAAIIGCPPERFAEAVADQRRAAADGSADATGRTDFPMGPLTAPYCVVRSVPALFHTQGGVDVDRESRVLTEAGEPIPGLFAVGGVAGGLSGRSGARGYSSGNGLLSAVGLGRVAGASAAGAAGLGRRLP